MSNDAAARLIRWLLFFLTIVVGLEMMAPAAMRDDACLAARTKQILSITNDSDFAHLALPCR